MSWNYIQCNKKHRNLIYYNVSLKPRYLSSLSLTLVRMSFAIKQIEKEKKFTLLSFLFYCLTFRFAYICVGSKYFLQLFTLYTHKKLILEHTHSDMTHI